MPGKWTVVVDEDIDAGDLDQVLWAICTRFDPVTDIDIIQKAWASKRDPLYLPGNFNNRILIDACIPYDMKLKGKFPPVVDVSPELRAKMREVRRDKFPLARALHRCGALRKDSSASNLSRPATRGLMASVQM